MIEPTPQLAESSRPVDKAWRLLTTSANHGKIWFAAGAVLALTGPRGRRAALRGIGTQAAASLLTNVVIKQVVQRRRPDPARTPAARQLRSTPWTSSFPSGHSASAGAFAVGAAIELPVAGAVLLPLGAAVGWSRVHVGVHYASDVAAGLAIGAGLAFVGKKLWPVRPWGAAVTAPATAPPLPGGKGLTVVVNGKSGSSDGAVEALRERLPDVKIIEWDPEDDLAEAVGGDPLALGVAGGDGTVATVAALAQERNLPLAVFPFGTLNHFAKAIGLPTDEDTALAVEAGTAGAVDVARINGEVFLNTAGIGGYPQMVIRRDRYTRRMGKWPATALALVRTLRKHTPLDLEINGARHKVWVVFVGNGVYQPKGLSSSWREDLVDGLLDVQYLRADVRLARTRGVLMSLLGLVERSHAFGNVQASDVTILSHEGPITPAHDGEVGALADRIELGVDKAALTVYRP